MIDLIAQATQPDAGTVWTPAAVMAILFQFATLVGTVIAIIRGETTKATVAAQAPAVAANTAQLNTLALHTPVPGVAAIAADVQPIMQAATTLQPDLTALMGDIGATLKSLNAKINPPHPAPGPAANPQTGIKP